MFVGAEFDVLNGRFCWPRIAKCLSSGKQQIKVPEIRHGDTGDH